MKKRFIFFALSLVAMTANAQLCPDNQHPHMIDLDLPSGTKWACCNVDASKPEEFGGYYSWGETKTRDVFEPHQGFNSVGLNIAGTEYDVAHVKWGDSWVIPTSAQIEELFYNCTNEWLTENGVNGVKFISKKNGSSIFLPFAGYRLNRGVGDFNTCYWSANRHPATNKEAVCLYFSKKNKMDYCDSKERYFGFTVRPVVSGSKPTRGASYCPDDNHPHMIDLGLPSGTKWACCNVDANSPEETGGYYSWGVTVTQKLYDKSSYKYNYKESSLGSDIAGTKYDVAHVKWGDSWVMPTIDQIRELFGKASYDAIMFNGVYGRLFTGPSGGKIFLPYAGCRDDQYNKGSDDYGYAGAYWSSTYYETYSSSAFRVRFIPGNTDTWSKSSYEGCSVRPVSK